MCSEGIRTAERLVPDCHKSEAGMYLITSDIPDSDRLLQATSSIPIRLEWLNNKHLVDLDFADDIALTDII